MVSSRLTVGSHSGEHLTWRCIIEFTLGRNLSCATSVTKVSLTKLHWIITWKSSLEIGQIHAPSAGEPLKNWLPCWFTRKSILKRSPQMYKRPLKARTHIWVFGTKSKQEKKDTQIPPCRCPHEPCRHRQRGRHRDRGCHSCEVSPWWHLTSESIAGAVSHLESGAHCWGLTREMSRGRERDTACFQRGQMCYSYTNMKPNSLWGEAVRPRAS